MPLGARIQITERLALDPDLSFNSTTGNLTYGERKPYTGQASQTLLNNTIGGGVLGPNGYMEAWFTGIHSITAGNTVSVSAVDAASAASTTITTLSGPALAGGTTYYCNGTFRLQNQDSETSGLVMIQMDWPLGTAGNMQSSRVETAHAIDTSVDFTPVLNIAGTTVWLDGSVLSIDVKQINTYYIP